MSAQPTPSRGGIVAAYAVWVALVILSGLALAEVHTALLGIAIAMRVNPWVAGAVRQLALPVLGLIWLVWIFVMESALRTGARTGRLWPRVARALGSVAAVWLVGFVVRTLV